MNGENMSATFTFERMSQMNLDQILNLVRQGFSLEQVTYPLVTTATCSSVSGTIGDTITITATQSGGTAPYTVNISKDQTLLKQFTGIAESQQVEFDYITTNSDIGTHTITTDTSDSCLHDTKTCTKCYDVTINTVQTPVTTNPLVVGLLGLIILGAIIVGKTVPS